MNETTLTDSPPAAGCLPPARYKRAIMVRCDPDDFARLHRRRHDCQVSLNTLMLIATGSAQGVCQVCACTDERGCADGCTWANEGQTLCSRCAEYLDGRSQWTGLGLRRASADGERL